MPIKEDIKENFQKKVEENTGIIGQAMREKRKKMERQQEIAKEVNEIKINTGRLKTAGSYLTKLEVSFLQISKNVQLMAKALNAQVTLQDETNKALQTSPSTTTPELSQPKTGQAQLVQTADDKENQSLLDKISDLVDMFDKKSKTKTKPKGKQTPKEKAKAAKVQEKEKAKAAKERAKVEEKATSAKQAAEAEAKAAGKSAKEVTQAGKSAAKQVVKKATQAQVKVAARKALAKSIGKMFAKAIPFVGAAAGVAFAVQQLMKGNVTGAGFELAGGLAGPVSSIPASIGSAVSEAYIDLYGVDIAVDMAQDPEGTQQRVAFLKGIVEEEAAKMLKDKVEVTEPKAPEGMQFDAEGNVIANYTPAPAAPPTPPPKQAPTPVKQPQTAATQAPGSAVEGQQKTTAPAAPPPAAPPPPPSAGTGIKPGGGQGLKPGGGEGLKVPTMTGDDKDIMAMIKRHEGFKLKPYKDSLGLWTIGVGHLIGDGRSLPPEWNREFTNQEVDALFAKDYEEHKKLAMKSPGWEKANKTGQAAIIDLTFNMGGGWYKIFKKASAAMAEGDFKTAADQLMYKNPATGETSRWYDQVKGRAVEIVAMLRQGGPSTGAEVGNASTEVAAAKQVAKGNAPLVVVNNNTNVQNGGGAQKAPQSQVTRTVGA